MSLVHITTDQPHFVTVHDVATRVSSLPVCGRIEGWIAKRVGLDALPVFAIVGTPDFVIADSWKILFVPWMPATQQEHPVLKGECPCAIARRVGCLVGDIGPLIIGDCLGGSDLKRSQVDGHRPAARVADPNETTLGDAVWYVPAQRTCGQGARTGGDSIPAGATADLGFALILAAARRVTEGDRFSRRPDVTVFDPGDLVGREVYGQTLGIIGLGQIGAEVARRARGFDMTVVYHNRQRRTDVEPLLEARYVSLSELLEVSDFVLLSVPLTEQTQGMIGSGALAQMKSTATLVNIARGAVVDTAALTAALQNGDIHSAALDVTEPEPLPRDHPLLTMDNVTITPHLGTASAQTRQRMNEISVENLLRGVRGEPLLFEVNPASG